MIVAMALSFQIFVLREQMLNTLYKGRDIIIETQWSDVILFRPLGEGLWYYRVIPSIRSESAPHFLNCTNVQRLLYLTD